MIFNKISNGEKVSNTLLDTKTMIQLNDCQECFQEWVNMLNVLIKLIICLFWLQMKVVRSKVWDKISNVIQKGFDSEPVYNEKFHKTKIKYYDSNIFSW